MAQITLNINDKKKEELEEILDSMGLDFDAFFSVYATKVIRDRCIPFYIEAPEGDDPFYSKENMERLSQSIAHMKAGRGVEHDLIEVD
ncbi:MAG: type II toxin-antitoxin system RelB/DinJ family antitoxin [Synergistaceae bacterium]|nr:type II toxin-antitoxin system RelB/DinJ family antitoxin [Synergistaceae bacterium]